MKKILLYGAGSGSREILLMIQEINKIEPIWEVLGFVDEDPKFQGKEVDGYPVYGKDHKEIAKDVYGVCGILDSNVRRRIFDELIEGKGLSLATIISPSSSVPKDFEVGPGTIIMPSVTISFDVKLGKGVLVLWKALLGHHLRVGDYSNILSSACIGGGCSLGSGTIIGANATLINLSLGNNCVVGAGTTVFESFGDNKSIVNLPRQIVSERK